MITNGHRIVLQQVKILCGRGPEPEHVSGG